MNVKERIKSLKSIDLFASFSDAELKSFAENISEEKLEQGDILFQEGAPGEDMFILLEGTLKVFKESRVITIIKPVDYIGEMAIIETKPRSATVQALEPSLLLQVTSDQFQEYLGHQPKSLVSMMRTLSQRIRRDTELIADEFEKANIMIHDMKNLLSVFLFLDPLKRELPNGSSHQYVEHMQTARKNLGQLMEEALANAKRLHMPPTMLSDSLNGLINDTVNSELLIQPDLKDKKIDIVVKEALPNFPFCQLYIRRVLSNLVLNAAQASKPGDTIIIELDRKDNFAEVNVKDKGDGIPNKLKSKIFEPHFTTKETGNGLGLASCRYAVEKIHGGNLSFRSGPEGTTFTFTLPLERST